MRVGYRSLAVAASMRRPASVNNKIAESPAGDRTRGREASCGGSACFWGRGGTRPPRLSLWGKRERGIHAFLPCCRRLVLCFIPINRYCLATADSPCFHSHSCVEQTCSGASWCPQSCNGCCHLSAELSVSLAERTRSAATSQSPELGDLQN
jgi:hypothetical protein